MTSSKVFGHSLWRLHRECPKTSVITVMHERNGEEKRRKARTAPQKESCSKIRMPPDVGLSCLPHASPGRPSRSIAKRARRVGEEREGGEGRALAGGKGPPVALGVGGPPNGSWGQTHIWGLSKSEG